VTLRRRAPGAPRKRKNNIEDQHQRALIKWAAHARLPDLPHIEPGSTVADYLFAIPNGGGRSKVEAALLKAGGVKAGVWDLLLPLPMHGSPGLWVEMKAPAMPATDITAASARGTPSKDQIAWGKRMALAGYATAMCWSWEAARNCITAYINARPLPQGEP
jgi:hypothetical protein